jgi:hypothetical protein
MLQDFTCLQVRLTVFAEDILRHKNLLAELDRQHAVTVEVVLPGTDPEIPEVREALRTVRALAALGLAVRTISRLSPAQGGHETLKRLFEKVRKAGAFDMRWVAEKEAEKGAEKDAEKDAEQVGDLARLCRILSLEHGFPLAVAGRG